MKKSFIIIAIALFLLTSCSEDKEAKKEQKTEQTSQMQTKQEIVKVVENTKENKEHPKVESKIDEKIVEEVKKIVDAEAMFKVCASCHGPKGEKEALGKSQAITGWDKDRTIRALNGYKNETYGGIMKGIMKQYIQTKTKEEIEALADFISKLQV